MNPLQPDQNAALADLNVALYRAKNTGLLALLSPNVAVDDFYAAVGELCVQTNSVAVRDPGATFTARVKAVMSGHDDEEVMVITMGVTDPDLYWIQEKEGQPVLVDHYVVNISREHMGSVEIVLPPETENLVDAVHQMMFCRVPASFRPQAWINDYAVDQDDGGCEFNAIKALLKMDLAEVKEMFARDVDFDCLADGLAQREAHSGPFEVDVDEADVVRMVCLLAGHEGRLSEKDSVSDITQPMWDDFVLAATSLERMTGCAAKLPEQAESETFSPAPGY